VRILFHIFFTYPLQLGLERGAVHNIQSDCIALGSRMRIGELATFLTTFEDIWIPTGTHCMACLTGHWRYLSVKSGTNQGTNQQQTPKSTDNCHQLGDPGLHISI
jgi:hypothetical protein